ncbi:hypothetical protein B0H12DRAFT_1242729 [Mycena haematopus]|nr:hypothetical protein B0H12DRAFT_1242729 [Mycena haematopus]
MSLTSSLALSEEDPSTSIVSRYKLTYPPLKRVPPSFVEHDFWNALCGADGIFLFRTAVLCITPGYVVTADQACVALSAGLMPFRLAISHLDAECEVPDDITMFLVRVRYLLSLAQYFDEEWAKFEWPSPRFEASQRLAKGKREPSRSELASAPSLALADQDTSLTTDTALVGNVNVVSSDYRQRIDASNNRTAISQVPEIDDPSCIYIFGHKITSFKTSRYQFSYPSLEGHSVYGFWDALCGPDGIFFARKAFVCTNANHDVDAPTACVALSAGLRPFRLAVSRLDATAFIDTDVTDFLVRVRKLVSIARDFDPEWSLFKWPITNYQNFCAHSSQEAMDVSIAGVSKSSKLKRDREHTTGKRMIMNFLDLEAEGCDDGEESDGSLTDESDDTDGGFDHATDFVFRDDSCEMGDEELRAVAHKFEERAKQDRAATIEGYSDGADPLVRAIDVGAAPLYMFSIPPSTEIEFLHFLTEKCTSAYSAFTPSLGSGIIYVETPSIALLQKDLKAYLGSYRIRRKPNALEILESVETLKMAPAIEHVGRFRRLRYRQQQLEAGDLVFATAPQVFLAIPRISYGPHEGHGPIPQALFDNEKFTKFCNGRVHDRRNHLVLVDKGRLVYQRNGLQRVDWQESHWRHMFIDGVTTPSDMELELFAAAKDVRMSTAPSLETYSALDNGDRVVGVHGRHEGRTGRICAVWTRNESSSSKRRRWAVVQDEEAFKVQLAVPYRNNEYRTTSAQKYRTCVRTF